MFSTNIFGEKAIKWYGLNKRDLPWRKTLDPYVIWLSEIILQQTRISQGLPYFNKFIDKYPDVRQLASADEQTVLKLWEGLGYYSRARKMMETARVIVNEYDGKFPNSYKELLKLKGVGQYTAAAIASIAFGESVAVVDGNVYRLLSRFFGISTPIDDKTGVTEFALKSNELLGTHNPGIFNQAIMELGALVCLPNNPKCDSCPLRDDCVALKEDRISMLPVKEKRLKKRKRFFNYLFIKNNERTYLHKREAKDIWQGLYEFPLIETNTFANRQTFTNCKDWKRILKNSNYKILEVSDIFSQTLTHQRIEARFWEIEIDRRLDLSENNFIETGMDNVNDYPFPKIMICYLDEIVLVLQ